MTALVSAIQRSLSAPSQSPSQSTANLCQYCLRQPKFQNHPYCSKTCAGQAALLCDHCHKKPKFQGFEYCGKNCASLANPGGKAGRAQRQKPPPKWPAQSKGNKFSASMQTTATKSSFDPSNIPNLGVAQNPRVQSVPAPNYPANGPGAPVYHMGAPMTAARPTVQTAWFPHPNNPFPSPNAPNMTLGSVTGYPSNSTPVLAPSRHPGNVGNRNPGREPVYVGGNGSEISQYSSMRHREEGVASDPNAPCVMCLVRPQSENDYFCGRECREASMNKYRGGGSSPTNYNELPDIESPTM